MPNVEAGGQSAHLASDEATRKDLPRLQAGEGIGQFAQCSGADEPAILAELLLELIAEVRGLRADLSRQRRPTGTAPLRAAIAGYFGPGRFTARGLILAFGDVPALADALAGAVDMTAPSPARALGMLLAADPHFERVASRDGAAVYQLADADEDLAG